MTNTTRTDSHPGREKLRVESAPTLTDPPARRKMLRAIGTTAGASALIPLTWSAPIVRTTILPAHAAASPRIPTCFVGVTWANTSSVDTVCLSVEEEGGAPIPEFAGCIPDGNSPDSRSAPLPPGLYFIVMTVNLAGAQTIQDYSGTVSCCSGGGATFQGLYSRLSTTEPASSSFTEATVQIDENGQCQVLLPG